MAEKQRKTNIKKTNDFISLWVKFHDFYKNAAKKDTITQEEENIFLETKSLITRKYEDLKNSIKLSTATNDEMKDVISHVLSLKGMAAMSDRALSSLEKNWEHSYVFLNKILKDLENRSQAIAEEKRPFEFFKKFLVKILTNKVIQLIILILAVFTVFYIINMMIRIFVKQ